VFVTRAYKEIKENKEIRYAKSIFVYHSHHFCDFDTHRNGPDIPVVISAGTFGVVTFCYD
jgi:hypothetical protein